MFSYYCTGDVNYDYCTRKATLYPLLKWLLFVTIILFFYYCGVDYYCIRGKQPWML